MHAKEQQDRSSLSPRPQHLPRPAALPQPRGGRAAEGLLALQRTAGNGAVVQMLRQAEHDGRAGQAGHDGPDRESRGHPGSGPSAAPEPAAVQRSAVRAVLRSAGRPLGTAVREEMESRLGADFSDVRVHTDSMARASAADIGARAYTSGRHVVLGDGGMDKHTLAHELTHVVQQRQGPVPGTDNGAGLSVSDPSDGFEREAEENATRAMRGSPPVRRDGAGKGAVPGAEHPLAPVVSGDLPVQRALVKDSSTLYKKWAQDGSARTAGLKQRKWLWNQLVRLCGSEEEAKKKDVGAAVALLNEHNVTADAMNEALRLEAGEQAAAAEGRDAGPPAEDVAEEADRVWREKMGDALPKVERVAFEIPGLGEGVVGMLSSPRSNSNPGMLAWFSHGFQDAHPVAVGTERRYGFAVQQRKSLLRMGEPEVYATLPKAMKDSSIEPTTKAPGLYVLPHGVAEIAKDITYLVAVVEHCDVAVLLDFRWAESVSPEWESAKKATTPPLPVIIEGTPHLAAYSSLLLYTCRTPWSVNAAMEGSGQRISRLAAELREQAEAEGRKLENAESLAQQELQTPPSRNRVHT